MDATKAKQIVASLNVEDILKSYSGKPGCMCGCNGDYHVTAETREEASKERGYPYTDEDVSRAQVMGVLAQVALAAEAREYVDIESATGRQMGWGLAEDLQYVVFESPKRTYAVYLTQAARDRLQAQ